MSLGILKTAGTPLALFRGIERRFDPQILATVNHAGRQAALRPQVGLSGEPRRIKICNRLAD